jgi:hypothetical protein
MTPPRCPAVSVCGSVTNTHDPTSQKGGNHMKVTRVYEEGLVKEWHGNVI